MTSMVWEQIRLAKRVRIPLDEFGAPDFYVEILPTAFQPPSLVERLSKIADPVQMQAAYMAACVVGWNLTDENGQPLPLPSEGNQWMEILPMALVVHIARRIAEIDQKEMEIPPTRGGLSSSPSEGTEAVRPGLPESS